jgi:acyl-CoA reductase-like NAD-dependent aldehyde dehydrogenase
MPAGVVNILTGDPAEIAPVLAGHMDVNALDLTGIDGDAAVELERLAAASVKRVVRGAVTGQSVWEIEPLVEAKTVWHPIGV